MTDKKKQSKYRNIQEMESRYNYRRRKGEGGGGRILDFVLNYRPSKFLDSTAIVASVNNLINFSSLWFVILLYEKHFGHSAGDLGRVVLKTNKLSSI
jgi:hypothetical protein